MRLTEALSFLFCDVCFNLSAGQMETESHAGQLENMHGCCASNNHAGRLDHDDCLLLKDSSEIGISRAKVRSWQVYK